MESLEQISQDAKVMGGKPTIRGLRITVGTVVCLVASDHSFQQILDLYPDLEENDIQATLSYAALRASEVASPGSIE